MLKQHLQFKLSQKLSPQQIQLMKLIQLPTQAFEQRIKQELEENPALESGKHDTESSEENFEELYEEPDDSETIVAEDINIDEYLSDDEIPGYRTQANNYSPDEEEKSIPYASGTSFNQYLIDQLNTVKLDEASWAIAEFLVGSIDESGYIRRSLAELMDDLAFTQNIYTTEEKIAATLKIVQQLDPPGVGARSLEESLILQLERKAKTPAVTLAVEILERSFDHFIKKHYDKLLQRHETDEEALKKAISEIEKLTPKPGAGYSGNIPLIEHIVPDFSIKIIEGELELTLNGRNAPELHISREYTNMLEGYKHTTEKSQAQKDTVLFIKQKLDAAKWFIDAIKQRQQTLYVAMNAIINYQRDYFLTGDERKLRPMILKDIADEVGMDVSTISRVASSKYVDTPYGTKLIKDYFSESMKNEQGEDISTKKFKNILETLIKEENKKNPLSDAQLAKKLKESGYPIARRTVAKYREQMGIAVARLRKEL